MPSETLDQPAANVSPPTSFRSKRRRIVFRLIAILFPLLVLAGVEGYFRYRQWGVNTSLSLPHPHDPSSHYLNPKTDLAYCVSDLRGPEPRSFSLPKSPKKFRVVVVGASTVQGYPFPSELSFPRQMELILSKQIGNRDVEILNAGIVGLSTLPLADVVRQATQLQPDAIVMYEGHNEFYGVGGVATNAETTPWNMTLRRFRLIQALSNPENPQDELITRLPKQLEILADDPLVSQAEQRYERHLHQMADHCHHAGIPLLLCSVVSNVRDQSPLARERESQAVKTAIGSTGPIDHTAFTIDRLEQIRDKLTELCEHDSSNALAHYRLAQTLELLNDPAAARAHYVLARDADACRYRAPSSFQKIVQRVTEQKRSSGVSFVDLVPAFDAEAKQAAPGQDLFLEHVHFTLEGHWLAARTMARSIIQDVCQQTWEEEQVPSPKERDIWLGVLPEDRLSSHGLAFFLSQTPPFNAAVDAKVHTAYHQGQILKIAETLPAAQQQIYASLHPKEKMDDLVDAIGRAYLNTQNFEEALRYFELGARRRPWMPNSDIFAAGCLYELRRYEEATAHLERASQAVLKGTPRIEEIRDRVERRLRLSIPKS